MLKRLLSIVAVLAMTAPVHADIYKWVDENGKVHYSDQPPPAAKPAEISKIKADTLDEVSKQAAAERMERLRQGESPSESSSGSTSAKPDGGLDCIKAVSNANEWLDSMKDVGRANVKSGHLSEANYEEGRTEIEKLRKRLSISDCNRSTGRTRQFYECTSNLNNHVAMCASQHLE